MHRLIIYRMDAAATGPVVEVYRNREVKEVNRVAKIFCGHGWAMDRRPGVHTFGNNIAARVEFVKDKA